MPSAVIRSFRYLADRHELEITFQSGRVYAFHDVPRELARRMRSSAAKGEYFNKHIRGAFPYEHRDFETDARATLSWSGH